MELVSKKVLLLLCVLFFTAALVEGFYLYKNQTGHRSHPTYFEPDPSHPFAFSRRPFTPWNAFPKDFMRGWDDDSFFGGNLPRENFFQESVTFNEPEREEKGNEVRLTFDIKGHEKGNYEVKISDHQLTVTGKDDQKSRQESKGFWPWSKKAEEPVIGESHWSQTQSFPLPDDVDPKSYLVERTPEKLVVVFKKLSAINQEDSRKTL